MPENVADWAELLKNVLPFIVIIYYILNTIRNWGGTPELKLVENQMTQTNQHLAELIKKLP